MSIERKCLNCNTWNTDNDYCIKCGEPISPEIIEEKREEQREIVRKNRKPTSLDIFIDKWKNSRFFVIKALYYVFYTIGFIFFAIAGFFAWIAASPNG